MSKYFDLMKNIVMVLNTFVRVEEQNLTEEQQTAVRTNINAASQPELTEVKAQVANMKADMDYVPIDITGISCTVTKAEIGSTVDTLTVSWTTNKTPNKQTMNHSSVDVSETSKQQINVRTDTTYTLRVWDERDTLDMASVSISFLNGVYYGASAEPETLDSAFILGLTKELSGSKGRTITVNAAEGQRIWYALPVRLGECSFSVGGFTGGFDLVDTIDFRNNVGYTEPYNVYASAKSGLGETKVVVS